MSDKGTHSYSNRHRMHEANDTPMSATPMSATPRTDEIPHNVAELAMHARKLEREITELRKTLTEQIIEADTMRKHYQTVEALLFEAQVDKERLDWILSDAGRFWLSTREDIDKEMEESQ